MTDIVAIVARLRSGILPSPEEIEALWERVHMATNLVEMSRAMQALNALIDDALFGPAEWPVDAAKVGAELIAMRLQEAVPGKPLSFRNTELGRLMHLDLHMAFLGILDESTILVILKDYDLLTRRELDWFWDRLEAGLDVSNCLKSRLQLAYWTYFGQSNLN